MSNRFNDEILESSYGAGYDEGYDDGYENCRSELEMKIKKILRLYLYSEKVISPWQLSLAINEELKCKTITVSKTYKLNEFLNEFNGEASE